MKGLNSLKTVALLLTLAFVALCVPYGMASQGVTMEFIYKNPEDLRATVPSKALASAWNGPIASDYAEGNGSKQEPYRISNAEELAYFALCVNQGESYAGRYFTLTADILLNDTTDFDKWGTNDDSGEVIASDNEWVPIMGFEGNLDGCGHSINGLYINEGLTDYVGLFGTVRGVGTLESITLQQSYVLGRYQVGAFVGNLEQSFVLRNLINKALVFGAWHVGGICGVSSSGDIDSAIIRCVNYGNVTGINSLDPEYGQSLFFGGIVGLGGIAIDCVNYGEISSYQAPGGISGAWTMTAYCINNGRVQGNRCAGGIVGAQSSGIYCCYNLGQVTAVNYGSGGIMGWNNACDIIDCYSTGLVHALDDTSGGIYGYFSNDYGRTYRVLNCYYLNTSCNKPSPNGLGRALTDAQMRDEQSYTADREGFGFDLIWIIQQAGDYPYPQLVRNVEGIGGESAIWDGSIAEGFAGGDGSAEAPYQIANAEQLAYFAESVNDGTLAEGLHYVLTSNIALNDTSVEYWTKNAASWTPIGTCETPFSGYFDGAGHTVSGIYIDEEIVNYVGLFGNCGCVYGDLDIRRVGVTDSYIFGYRCVGGAAGYFKTVNEIAFIENCYSTATVIGGIVTGGIAGGVHGGAIDGYNFVEVNDCYVAGEVRRWSVYYAINGTIGSWGGIDYASLYHLDTCYLDGDSHGTALTHSQLQAQQSYVGFNFNTIWTMEGDPDYPYAELIPQCFSAIPGDADFSGTVDSMDALLILRHALGVAQLLSAAQANSDVDGNGSVNTSDALIVLRMARSL